MAPPPTPNEGLMHAIIVDLTEEKCQELDPDGDVLCATRSQHPIKPFPDRSPQFPSLPSPPVTRDRTPLRPVYIDFATAHSSITSGSGKSQFKSESKEHKPIEHSGFVDRSPQLPHQVTKSLRQQNNQLPGSGDLKSLGKARISHAYAISELDYVVSRADFTSICPPKIDLSSSMPTRIKREKSAHSSPLFNSLRKVLRKKTSLTSKASHIPNFRSSPWARDSIELTNVPRKAIYSSGSEVARNGSHNPFPLMPRKELQGQLDEGFHFEDPFTKAANHLSTSLEVTLHCTNQQGKFDAELYHEQSAEQSLSLQRDTTSLHRYSDGRGLFKKRISFSGERSSAREGSTVDNILKEYGSDHRIWDVSLDSNKGNSDADNESAASLRQIEAQSQINNSVPSSGYFERGDHSIGKESCIQYPQRLYTNERQDQTPLVKLVDPPGEAPIIALPYVPRLANQRAIQRSSTGIRQTSSYDDTENLLNLTQCFQRANAGNIPVFEDQELHPSRMKVSSQAGLSDCNPYRRGLNKSQALTSSGGPDNLNSSLPTNEISRYVNSNGIGMRENPYGPHLNLDRDVSNALHRASGFSYPSQETQGLQDGHGGFQSSTDSSGFSNFVRKQERIIGRVQKHNPKGFYHESAIHQTWLGSQQMSHVRVPINHRGSRSQSFRLSLSASGDINCLNPEMHDEDGNDWETLPETGAASQAVTNLQDMMGQFNQAGSSVANTSDEGEISPVLYVHHNFSSTDRIIQHPANIDYSLDYRQREIKGENFPVLLPSYQQHTVNGFPANSNRPNPFQHSPGDFYNQQAAPLSIGHTNPFRRPLPESMNISQPSDDALKYNQQAATSSGQVPLQDRDILDRWINGFGDSQPEFKLEIVSDPTEIVTSSRKYKSAVYANPRPHRHSISVTSFSTLGAFIESRMGHQAKVREAANETVPPTKRPPGAFYLGVRSTTNSQAKSSYKNLLSHARYPQKQSPQSYPTNQMRPLSLLRAHPPLIRTEKIDDHLVQNEPDEFLYRSPLAPVKSKNWRILYTKEQLSMIRSAAKDDGICDVESQQSQSSCPKVDKHLQTNGSLKRLPWSPRMSAWPRDNSSVQTDLASRKSMISTLVFAFCCLFPLVLILYGFGYMDNIMLWITDGEIRTFNRSHKRLALLAVCFFIIVSLVTIPLAVVLTVQRRP